jgi:hypothetical protein
MRRVAENETREDRIRTEIVVDAHADEQAMGWYYYLEEKLAFPFDAKCIAVRATSPLRKGETVKAIGMTAQDECAHEMFVDVEWSGRTLGVPLTQLQPVASGRRASAKTHETAEAIADWHYWVARGYELG